MGAARLPRSARQRVAGMPSEEAEPVDATLVERLRAGDSDAFAEVVRAWSPMMLQAARAYVSTDASAQEVVQDAWLAIISGLDKFETAAGALKFPGLQNNPPTLLGRSAHELSNMDPDFGKLRAGVWRLLEFHSCRSLPVPGRADPEP